MKKINFRSSQVPLGLLTILLTTNLVFAGGPQTIQDWLGLVESKTLGVESKIQSLEALISVANKKLAELKQQLASGNDPQCAYIRPNGSPITYPNVQAMNNAGAFSISPGKCEDVPKGMLPFISSNGCQKITNKMWLRTSRINDSHVNGDVSRIQKFFKSIGIINWDGDGEFGTWDRQAVWKFQQQYMPEISPTGDVGVKTMAKMNSMICNSVVVNDKDLKWNFSWLLTPTKEVSAYGLPLTTVKLTMWGGNNDKNKEVSFVMDNSCQIQYTTNAENGGIGPWLFCNGKHEFEKYAVFLEGGNYVIKRAVESGKDGSMPYEFFKQITFYN